MTPNPCPECPHHPASLSQCTTHHAHLIHSEEDFDQIFFPHVIQKGVINEVTVGKGGDIKTEYHNPQIGMMTSGPS